MHGTTVHRPLDGRRHDLHGDSRRSRVLQPQRRVQQSEEDGLRHRRAGAGNRHRFRQHLAHVLDRALGTDHFHGFRIGAVGADDEARRRVPVYGRYDRHLARGRALEGHGNGRWRHLHHLHTERHAHLLGRQRKQPPPLARRPEIDYCHHVSRGHPTERS